MGVPGQREKGANSPSRKWDPHRAGARSITSLSLSGFTWLRPLSLVTGASQADSQCEGNPLGFPHPSFQQRFYFLVLLPHLNSWLIFFRKILTSPEPSKTERDTPVMGAAQRAVWQCAHLSWLRVTMGARPSCQGASLERKRAPVAGRGAGQREAWVLASDESGSSLGSTTSWLCDLR